MVKKLTSILKPLDVLIERKILEGWQQSTPRLSTSLGFRASWMVARLTEETGKERSRLFQSGKTCLPHDRYQTARMALESLLSRKG